MTIYRNAMRRIGLYIDSRHWSISLLMAAVTVVTANIAIPLPYTPVPFTLQIMAVMASGLLLGARLGWLAQIEYLAIGFLGAPVFAGGNAGIAYLLNPRMTGGYLLAFPAAAWICGYAAQRWPSFAGRMAGCFAAIVVIYASGIAWMHFAMAQSISVSVAFGIIPFVVMDVIKAVIASVCSKRSIIH